MKKFNWILMTLMVFFATTTFQSCDNSDGYSIGDIGASWATVRVLGGNRDRKSTRLNSSH